MADNVVKTLDEAAKTATHIKETMDNPPQWGNFLGRYVAYPVISTFIGTVCLGFGLPSTVKFMVSSEFNLSPRVGS